MTKIYYYSGTGNTLWSAKKIAELLGGETDPMLYNIGVEAQKEKIVIEADAVVLLFPSYAFGTPLAVRRFAAKAVFKTPYLAAFVTFGTVPGGTLAEVARTFKRNKTTCHYYGRIPAVENYLAIFHTPKATVTEQRLAMQRTATEEAARCISERRGNRINTFRPFSAFVSFLFSTFALKIFYKRYRVSAACNGCGICEKVCPVSAITMRDNKPVFSKKCEHCQGCLNWCPQRSIHFGRLKANSPRYHHPEISISNIQR